MPSTKRKQTAAAPTLPEKTSIGLPDALEAAQERARLALEGNQKLSLAVDALRQALETIVIAEVDRQTGLPVSPHELRALAVQGLDAYSALTGQNWRRTKIVTTRAGDRNLATLENTA